MSGESGKDCNFMKGGGVLETVEGSLEGCVKEVGEDFQESENGICDRGSGELGLVKNEEGAELGVVLGKEVDVVMCEEKGSGDLLVKEEGGVERAVQNQENGEEGVKDLDLVEHNSVCEKSSKEGDEGVDEKVDVEMSEHNGNDIMLVKGDGYVQNREAGEGVVKDSGLVEYDCVGENSLKKLDDCEVKCVEGDEVNGKIDEKEGLGVIGNEEVEEKVDIEMSERDEKESEVREEVDVEMSKRDQKDTEVKEEKVENSEENENNGGENVGEADGEESQKNSGAGGKRGRKKKDTTQMGDSSFELRRSVRPRSVTTYREDILLYGDADDYIEKRKVRRRKGINGDGKLPVLKKEKGSTSSDDGEKAKHANSSSNGESGPVEKKRKAHNKSDHSDDNKDASDSRPKRPTRSNLLVSNDQPKNRVFEKDDQVLTLQSIYPYLVSNYFYYS